MDAERPPHSSDDLNKELLKQCLDYCSHVWPSEKVHESLLSNLSHSTGPEPDPADLSMLLFSDASDDESLQGPKDGTNSVKGFRKAEQVKTDLQVSAINPALTSKHAKIAQMQRMLHRDIERRHEHAFDGLRRKMDSTTEIPLTDPGISDTSPCAKCIGPEIQEGDSIASQSHEPGVKGTLDPWCTSITRRHQREVSMKELKIQEWNYLRSNFGKVMKDLESNVLSSQTRKVIDARPNQGQIEEPETLEEDMPEVASLTSIAELSQSECRRLLQQMKPLVHAPPALYRGLAKRALEEYAKFKPQTFFDCRRVTFWQFGNDKTRRQRDRTDRYAGQPFFNLLIDSDEKAEAALLERLPEMHRIAAVYMLQTLLESHNVVALVFQEVGRYVAERISDLDRDSLGRLVYIFAKAGVKNPGLFSIVKQECLRRCRLKEGEHSLSPKVISDVLVAFATAKIADDELFEALMVRAVSLMDTDLKPELPCELCAPAKSCAGDVPATPFLLQDLVQISRSFLDLQRVDQEFFDDMSMYIVKAVQSPNEKMVDWFVGNPASLSHIANVFIKARIFKADLFSILKTLAARRKEDMRSESLQQLRQAFLAQKGEEEKQERKKWQPPERRRGGMGRAVIGLQPPKIVQTRREKAREQRQRLAAMSAEEVAKEIEENEKHAGLSASAKVLLSGYKVEAILEAQEGPKEGKRTKSEVMEASTAISIRSMVKGKKARHEESSASAKAELRKHSRSKR